MQHEITKKHDLLRLNGVLAEAGYARKLLLNYDRSAIKSGFMRIKEWDYYLITSDKFAVALTIADNSSMGLDIISFVDFQKSRQITGTRSRLLPRGHTNMPKSANTGDTERYCKTHFLSFKKERRRRFLSFRMDRFDGNKSIDGEITLTNPEGDSMVIAKPFEEDPMAFYYNQKINCMPAKGHVIIGKDSYNFRPDEAFGVMDWGRGVWPHKNTRYWGSASGILEGWPFGFNIGYGFGDDSAATENMIFYGGKGHKLSEVTFHIPLRSRKENYMASWFFTSDDDRFKMVFDPIIDLAYHPSFVFHHSDQHQVFGKYTGRVVLDDGTILRVKDFLGFAEKVINKW